MFGHPCLPRGGRGREPKGGSPREGKDQGRERVGGGKGSREGAQGREPQGGKGSGEGTHWREGRGRGRDAMRRWKQWKWPLAKEGMAVGLGIGE